MLPYIFAIGIYLICNLKPIVIIITSLLSNPTQRSTFIVMLKDLFSFYCSLTISFGEKFPRIESSFE